MSTKRLLCLAACAAALWPGAAPGRTFQGNDAALSGGALGGVTRGPEATWYNPAGLGGLNVTKLDLSATALRLRINRVDRIVDLQLPSGTYSTAVNSTEFVTIPTGLVFTRHLSDRISVGLGIFVVDQSDIAFRSRFEPRLETFPLASGGTLDLTHTMGIETDLQASLYYIGPAFGFEILPSFRLGVALYAVYLSGRVAWRSHVSGTPPGTTTPAMFFTNATSVKRGMLGLEGAAGAQLDLGSSFRLGLTVRSPAAVFYQWGEVSTTLSALSIVVDASGNLTNQPGFASAHTDLDEWGFDALLPVRFSLAAAYTGQRLQLAVAGEVAPALESTDLGIDQSLVWNVSAGGTVVLTDTITVGAGLYTDHSATRQLTDLGDVDVDHYGLSAGVRLNDLFRLEARTGRRDLRFSTVIGVGYALGIGEAGGWVYDSARQTGIGDLVERDATFHDVSFHIGSSLQF